MKGEVLDAGSECVSGDNRINRSENDQMFRERACSRPVKRVDEVLGARDRKRKKRVAARYCWWKRRVKPQNEGNATAVGGRSRQVDEGNRG